MAEVIHPVGSGCTTAFSYLKAYLQVSAKAGPSNVISFSCIILIIFFFGKFTFIFLACSYAIPHSILASVFSPVRHELQPIGHFRVWDVLHLKQKLTVSAQGGTPSSCLVFESSHHLDKLLGKLHDGNLACRSHVVDFSRSSLFQQQEEGFDGVVDKQKVAGYRKGSLDSAVGGKKKKALFFSYMHKTANRWEHQLISQFTNHFLFICRRERNLGITWRNSRRTLILEPTILCKRITNPFKQNEPSRCTAVVHKCCYSWWWWRETARARAKRVRKVRG